MRRALYPGNLWSEDRLCYSFVGKSAVMQCTPRTHRQSWHAKYLAERPQSSQYYGLSHGSTGYG